MYEIPSRDDITKCVVRGDTIWGESPPLLITRSGARLDIASGESESAQADSETA